jgi:hypothetical protein
MKATLESKREGEDGGWASSLAGKMRSGSATGTLHLAIESDATVFGKFHAFLRNAEDHALRQTRL